MTKPTTNLIEIPDRPPVKAGERYCVLLLDVTGHPLGLLATDVYHLARTTIQKWIEAPSELYGAAFLWDGDNLKLAGVCCRGKNSG